MSKKACAQSRLRKRDCPWGADGPTTLRPGQGLSCWPGGGINLHFKIPLAGKMGWFTSPVERTKIQVKGEGLEEMQPVSL